MSTEQICTLNDRLRTQGIGGRILVTQGVHALGESFQCQCISAVRGYDAFTEDNDPHGEHDFGSFMLQGHRLFWKIDYYDAEMEFGSPEPANPALTTRVLTIMLAEEY